MSHHGDPVGDHPGRQRGAGGAAFELDGLGPGLEEGHRVGERVFDARLVASERHVGDQHGAAGPALDCPDGREHLLHRYRQGGFVAQRGIREAVADKDQVHPRLLENRGAQAVEGGQGGDLFSGELAGFQARGGHLVLAGVIVFGAGQMAHQTGSV